MKNNTETTTDSNCPAATCCALVRFPKFTGIRCLMLPYIQGRPETVPEQFRHGYEETIENVFIDDGQIGFLTIDESVVRKGKPHRGARSKTTRAIHTEAGRRPDGVYAWGGSRGSSQRVTLDAKTKVLLANSLSGSCAIWDVVHENTSSDGDIGDQASLYPYESATMMGAGKVHKIGILTPHESLPVRVDTPRQFLRVIGRGVHGREPHFTENPLLAGEYVAPPTTQS